MKSKLEFLRCLEKKAIGSQRLIRSLDAALWHLILDVAHDLDGLAKTAWFSLEATHAEAALAGCGSRGTAPTLPIISH